MVLYCLDSNVFIESKNGPYGFDIVPGFWEWIDRMVQNGQVYSTVTVYDELTEGNDELAEWAKARRYSGLFVDHDNRVQSTFQAIANHVATNYERHHSDTFLDGADPWVIAQAHVDNAIVVTREAAVNTYSKKVMIPNVCNVFDVECIDTFAMLRNTGASFR
jgi:predicted nucleic acid-binding protein